MKPEQPKSVGQPPKDQIVSLDINKILRDKPIEVPENSVLIGEIQEKRKNALVSLVLHAGVQLDNSIILPLFEILRKNGITERLDLFLFTTGGATEVPWRIVSLLREFCSEYYAIIPHIALSAGTHIALGANALVMSEISTLGPVDPTRNHPLLPKDKNDNPIPVSVEDLKHCIKFISQQIEEKYTPSDMATIINTLFNHIEPLAIGAIEQSYMLSRYITQKVLETHLNPNEHEEKIKKIVAKIGGEYYSHSFPITRRDVEKDLGLSVIRPDQELWNSVWNLHLYYQSLLGKEMKLTLGFKNAQGIEQKEDFFIDILGFIDIINERRVLVGVKKIVKKGDKLQEIGLFKGWVVPVSKPLQT